jgi:hypothetical protein
MKLMLYRALGYQSPDLLRIAKFLTWFGLSGDVELIFPSEPACRSCDYVSVGTL